MSRRVVRVSHLPLPIFNIYEGEWDVISLPDNLCSVNPIHTTSKIIQHFLKKIETRHDTFIKNLGTLLSEINTDVEDTIRMKCKSLKKEFRYLIMSGHNYIRYNLDNYQTDPLHFDDYKFERCKKYCSSLIMQGKSKIYDFYAFMKSVEKYRSEKFKDVLTKSYDRLLKINTKTPYEVQLFFEDQILAYNQIVLSNLRSYKDIEAHLILVFTNEVKLMLYKILKFEECWKDMCKNEIINRLKDYNISKEDIENVLFKNESIIKIIKLFNTKIDHILQQMKQADTGNADTWLENMKTALNDLDTTAKQLINVYKTTADELYNKYYVESETVMEKMINKQFANMTEISDINVRFVNPIRASKLDENDLNNLWKETVQFVLEALYTKYKFLEELEQIFSMHKNRISKVKELVVDNLKKIISKHDNLLQGKEEAALNIILDTLRRDSTKNALDNTLKRAHSIINRIKHIIEKQKEEQLRVIKKFYEYTDNELSILKAELKIFVQKYSIEPVINVRRELNRRNYTSLFKILKETRDYFNELSIWNNKIIENIETLIVTCKQDQQNKAEQWVSEQEEFIMINFESKLDLHKCRAERIRKDIYDVRLAEIQMHESRFNSHSLEVQKSLDNIFLEQTNFENENSTFAFNLDDYMASTQIDQLENIKALEVSLLTTQTTIQKDSSKFEDIYNKQTEYINAKLDGLYSQNLLFLKSMKLFHEGGNFSSAEVKIFTKKIRQMNNNIKKKATTINSNLQTFKNKIDDQLQELRFKFDDRQKYAKIFFDFKIDVGNQFRNVQTAIKNVVVETKTDLNKTQTLNERLLKLLNLRCNPYPYLNYVIRDLNEVNERFSLHKENLEDFEDPPKLRPLPVKNSSNVSAKKSALSLTRSTVAIRIDNLKLFDNETDLHCTEDKFLSNIRKLLISSVHELERKAKRFYAAVRREDCIRFSVSSTLRSFIAGVLHKFTYYYLQCLQIWIIEIRDFIKMIHNLRREMADFCEKYLRDEHDNQVDVLEKTCNQYITDVKNSMNSALSNIKGTSDLLKPLYGYPGNQHMLHNLNEKVTNLFEESKIHFSASVVQPKKYIETAFNDYMEQLTKGKDKIEQLFVLIPQKTIYENLVTQVKNIMFTTNFDNLLMPVQCIEIIDNSEVDIGNINEIMCGVEPIRNTPAELKELFLQNFAEILGEKIEKLYELECEFINAIPEMKTLWDENVEKVIELYKIKYN